MTSTEFLARFPIPLAVFQISNPRILGSISKKLTGFRNEHFLKWGEFSGCLIDFGTANQFLSSLPYLCLPTHPTEKKSDRKKS